MLCTRSWNPGWRFDVVPVPRVWIEEHLGQKRLEHMGSRTGDSSNYGMILLKSEVEEVAAHFADAPHGPLFPPSSHLKSKPPRASSGVRCRHSSGGSTPRSATAASGLTAVWAHSPGPTCAGGPDRLALLDHQARTRSFGGTARITAVPGVGRLRDAAASVMRLQPATLSCFMRQTAGRKVGAKASLTACATRPPHCGDGCGPGPMAATSGPKYSASHSRHTELYSAPLGSPPF